MIRAACVALSLFCAVAAVACVDDSAAPAKSPPSTSAPPRVPATAAEQPLVEHVVDRAQAQAAFVEVPTIVTPPSQLEKEALQIDDGDLVDHKAEGLRLLAKGDAMNAIGELRKGLSIDSSADVWAALGDAYLRIGDAARRLLTRHFLAAQKGSDARTHAEEWVRLQPQDPQSRQALGRAYTQVGMWKEAIDEFVLVTDVQGDNAYAWNNLGFAALQLGDNERAAHALERVLSLKPQQGYMLNNLGVAYERLGRTAEAHAAFARAAELSPKYAQAALNRDRVQKGMSHAQRIVSNDTLLKLREGAYDDVAPLGGGSDGVAVPADVYVGPSASGE